MSMLSPIQDRVLGRSGGWAGFADPDWRGDRSLHDGAEEGRPLRSHGVILEQQRRIGALIRLGEGRGRLDAYQARRAAFDLQSIGAQVVRELGRRDSDDEDRRAIQSRLDRLEACVRATLTPDPR